MPLKYFNQEKNSQISSKEADRKGSSSTVSQKQHGCQLSRIWCIWALFERLETKLHRLLSEVYQMEYWLQISQAL